MSRALVALGISALACATPAPSDGPPYTPNRRDYQRFAVAWPELIEPNYLPFMTHRLADPDGGDDLQVFCRWPGDAMPLAVFVSPPVIPDALQNEFSPREPADYVAAVHRALATWEDSLEGLVRFRAVAAREDAVLEIDLLGEQAFESPDGDVRVLGVTRLGDGCQARAWGEGDRLDVRFSIEGLRVFVADEHGLLADDQVEWITLHEIGHALGMRGHSPIPADLMYEVVRDRLLVNEGLSIEDVNSFVSLYRLPVGTVLARSTDHDDSADTPPAAGEPLLSLAPHVDPRLGFSTQTPRGWTRIDSGRGMVAVDGLSWDYDASFQVVVERFSHLEEYLERYGAHYARHFRLLRMQPMAFKGRSAMQALLLSRREPRVEEVTLIEAGDRLIVVIADCPARDYHVYAPWFEKALGSLEVWPPDAPR